jgi:hypothetical protein
MSTANRARASAAAELRPWEAVAVGAVATGLLIVVAVLAITGVVRPVWSGDHPAPTPGPNASYSPPPPMAVDLRLLPAPTVGDQP